MMVCATAVSLPIALLSQTNSNAVEPDQDQALKAALGDSIKINNATKYALGVLAAERYSLNESRSNIWILALDATAISVEKYSDGRLTLVLLPKLHDDDDLGLGQFVSAYNHGNLKAADKMVASGKYQEAHKLYTVLLRYEIRDSMKDLIQKRLANLEKIRKGEDIQESLAAIKTLAPDYDLANFLEGLDSAPPRRVKDLLSSRFKEESKK